MAAGTSADTFQRLLAGGEDQLADSLVKLLAFPVIQISVGGIVAASATQTVWIADDQYATGYQILAARAVFSTAGGSGALADITVDTGTAAPGTGTAQTTAGMALNGTANTVVAATIIASPTNITSGNRIAIKLSGTLTALVGGVVTITLKRI